MAKSRPKRTGTSKSAAKSRGTKQTVATPAPAPAASSTPPASAPFADRFNAIIDQVHAEGLSEDEAFGRLMQQMDITFGWQIKALGRTHPQLAGRLARALQSDFGDQIPEGFSDEADAGGNTESAATKTAKPLTERAIKRRDTQTLQREKRVTDRIVTTDKPISTPDMFAFLVEAEPELQRATANASVSRLVENAVIKRSARGYYAAGPEFKRFRELADRELAARGELDD
ncbi:MAG: hypothetical protein AAFZ05_03315 [Pseudomonadota bacterium]